MNSLHKENNIKTHEQLNIYYVFRAIRFKQRKLFLIHHTQTKKFLAIKCVCFLCYESTSAPVGQG